MKHLTSPFKEVYRRAKLITTHYLNLKLLTCVSIVAFMTFTSLYSSLAFHVETAELLSEFIFPSWCPAEAILTHGVSIIYGTFFSGYFSSQDFILTRHGRSRAGCLVRINRMHVMTSIFSVFLIKITSHPNSLLNFFLRRCLSILLNLYAKQHAYILVYTVPDTSIYYTMIFLVVVCTV